MSEIYKPENTAVTIRLMTPEELVSQRETLAPQLDALMREAFPRMPDAYVASDVEDFFVSPYPLNGARRYCLLYEADGQLVGGRVFDVLDIPEGQALYLINNFVRPAMQKSGIATASTKFVFDRFAPQVVFSTAAQTGTNKVFVRQANVLQGYRVYPQIEGGNVTTLPREVQARIREIFAALYLSVSGSQESVERNLQILDEQMVRRGYNTEDLYGRNPWDMENDPIAKALSLGKSDGVLWVILADKLYG